MGIKMHPLFLPLLFVFLFLSSCASIDYEDYSQPSDDSGYAVASWYGKELHGRRTSSGQRFDMHDFTCAHRTYPFGTKLKITNIANGKTVECVVNDRGPTSREREIDLSYAAAKKIGITGKGAAKVRIEFSGTDHSSPED
jgi:rare lipoprotein A